MKITMRKDVKISWIGWAGGTPFVFREVEIPFAPFVGLSIDGETVTEVSYNTKTGEVDAYVESDESLIESLRDERPIAIGATIDEETVRSRLGEWQNDGWEIEGEYWNANAASLRSKKGGD